jgi:hypothetical protein
LSATTLIPVYRWPLSGPEKWSLDSLLANSPTTAIRSFGPAGLATPGLGLPYRPFAVEDFRSRDSYSRLLLSPRFYEAFADSEWLLIFQTDAVWLGGDLLPFLEGPSDYVGAPWLRTHGLAASGFSRVGNGGLSLRRTESFRRVLRGHARPATFLDLLSGTCTPDTVSLPPLARISKALRLWHQSRRGVAAYTAGYTLNEDRFWADRARVFDPGFAVATVEEGLRFAFEEAPRLAFQQNGRRLPLGAHAWQTYDPDFWYENVPGLPH